MPDQRILRHDPHVRHPWGGKEVVVVCSNWASLKAGGADGGGGRIRSRRLYERAKRSADREAAQAIVSHLCDDRVLDELIDATEPFMFRGTPIVYVTPTPAFNRPDQMALGEDGLPISMNALPQQYAEHLAVALGGTVDVDIVQAARVGRTSLTGIERFLWQPKFDGEVRNDVAYVLVDDVLTLGGTLACLRSHIIGRGGTVCASTALAHRSGRDQRLASSPETCDRLTRVFGDDIRGFWRREIGHDPYSLTEAEAGYLCRWLEERRPRRGLSPLQHLRACLFEAAGGSLKQVGKRGSSQGRG